MEIGYEMSPRSNSGSDCPSTPYSHMNEEEAQQAFFARKNQIQAMLKSRSSLQTPESNNSKYSINSSNSKKSSTQTKQYPSRFTTNSEKVSKASLDLSLQSQQQLKERLKNFSISNPIESKKYNISEPLYKRTVEWKQNLQKSKEEQKSIKDSKVLEECTFEPTIEKNEIRNMSVGIYERHLEWKNSMNKRNEKIKDFMEGKKLEECSFKPKIISSNVNFDADFQQRNIMWQERVVKKNKLIEEEINKNQVFVPRINKDRRKMKAQGEFDNRFCDFLAKIDEISDKIDKSLANSVL
ncbi:hypothetical protein SteCoe_19207 [Stentor coeruleus]|uniref:Uncharacterized protein n=1 Tax=Stentor coeruleus TaxID=5963 RepID=A0A1R2BUY8_9CILI|nr:hypothetical protein SteCoe_19207 [Stentor coeruleus]